MSDDELPAYFTADDEASEQIRAEILSPERRRRQGFALSSPDHSAQGYLPQSPVFTVEPHSRDGEEMAPSTSSSQDSSFDITATSNAPVFAPPNMSQTESRRPIKASTSIPVEWRLSTISEKSEAEEPVMASPPQDSSPIPSSSSPVETVRPSGETTSSSSGAPELGEIVKRAKQGRKTRVSLSIHKMGKRLFSSSSAKEPEEPFGQGVREATDALLETLPATIEKIDIDIFHPVALSPDSIDEEGRDAVEALVTLGPLHTFRNLKYLKITGMLDSYQSAIWLTAFLNPGLKYLHLEMALAPELSPSDDKKEMVSAWRVIDGSWKTQPSSSPDTNGPPKLPKHSGTKHGDGVLHADIGYGEYLDTLSMLHARNKASAILSPNVKLSPTQLKLRIEHLHLGNFVVDGLPFAGAFEFFDAEWLRWIEFGEGCVDAGFILPGRMDRVVSVGFPSGVEGDGGETEGMEMGNGGKGKGKDVDPGVARACDHDADEDGAGHEEDAGEPVSQKPTSHSAAHQLHRAKAVWIGNGSGVIARGPATVVMLDKKGKTKRVVGRDPWERMIG